LPGVSCPRLPTHRGFRRRGDSRLRGSGSRTGRLAARDSVRAVPPGRRRGLRHRAGAGREAHLHHDIASDPLKFEAVRAMQHFANASDAKLVAQGIENEADLLVVRDIGIGCGQGYFFSRPHAQPHIAVFPETTRSVSAAPSGGCCAERWKRRTPLHRLFRLARRQVPAASAI